MTLYSSRLSKIEPFHVVDLMSKASQLAASGRDIVHMEAGEPDFSTAAPIIDAGITALQAGLTQYTDAMGIMPLREKISQFYAETYQVNINPKRIIITPGASGALQLATLLLLNPDDGVILPDPTYPCNRQFIRLAGAEPQLVAVDAENSYRLTADKLQQAWQDNTRAVMVASPGNPTGALLKMDDLKQLDEFVKARSALLIVDEIYHGLTYDEKPTSILEITDDAVVINSFSKFFGMTGWRLGWAVIPESAIDQVEKLSQNMFISLSTPAQYAAIAGFDSSAQAILTERKAAFKSRRDFLVPALRALGFGVSAVPEGAFYVYADVSRFTQDSLSFCHQVLHDTGVAITPGCDFGVYKANHHVRFAFTTSLEQIEQGIDKLAQYLK